MVTLRYLLDTPICNCAVMDHPMGFPGLDSVARPSDAIDQLIAGHAPARPFTLVTASQEYCGELPGLALENWVDE